MDKFTTVAGEEIGILKAGTKFRPLWETVCWSTDGECRWSRLFDTYEEAKAELERWRYLED